jgi:PIN domain nuclease of toxin-antitoxin system
MSPLLLDSHAFLWWINGEEPLAPAAFEAVIDPTSVVVVSAASVWELSIKRGIGQLRASGSFEEEISIHGFTDLPISAEHAERAGGLPLHHRDPFDRMLVAQAQIEDLVLVTRDPAISAYEVRTLAC